MLDAKPSSSSGGPTTRWRPIVATATALSLVLAILFALWATVGIRAMRRALVRESERQTLALLQSLVLASQYSIATGTLVDQMERNTVADRARPFAESYQDLLDPRRRNELLAAAEASGLTLWHGDTLAFAYPDELSDLAFHDEELRVYPWDEEEDVVRLLVTDSTTRASWRGTGIPAPWGGLAVWDKQAPANAPAALGGVGELIQEIGRQSGVNYIMLQAPDGIVFASRPLKPILKLAADSFLVAVLESNAPATREIQFEGRPVLEAATPFLSTGLPSGMFRVGVSLTAVDEAVTRLTLQLGLTAILFLLLSSAVSAVLVTRRSLTDLGRTYRQVETLTGRVLDAIDQAVIAIDTQDRITIANPAAERVLGLHADQLIGALVSAQLGNGDFALSRVAHGGEIARDREEVRRTRRGARILVYSTTPLVTSDGVPSGAVTVIRDETEARAMAEEMRRGERLSSMGQLAAGVAHEIRNPLNAIALAAQSLRLELSDPDSQKLAETVWDESRRLNTIVEEFLSLARPSQLPRAPLDLAELLRDVSQMARLEADKKQVALKIDSVAQCPIHGVADELRKAVWNLFTNALAATPEGGEIRVTLAADSHNAHLVIEDSGEGIAPEALKRVFEPWFTTKTRGTGLGLAITHRIVHDHDGVIELVSPRPDGKSGTRVTVDLPVMRA
jgi:PAS domain S-box-containing protein